jgi:hypothetical protein
MPHAIRVLLAFALAFATVLASSQSARAQARLIPVPSGDSTSLPGEQSGVTIDRGQTKTRDGDNVFAETLERARAIATTYPSLLDPPDDRRCPCTEAEIRKEPRVWKEDTFSNIRFYHPGAKSSFRSRKTYSSAGQSAGHGQQCTYDKSGNLITGGSGAGTPDVFAPKIGQFTNHSETDVKPWEILGWQVYTEYWRPNNGCGCRENIQTQITVFPNSMPASGPTRLPRGVVGEPYSVDDPVLLRAEGGKGAIEWEIVAGRLPDGLRLKVVPEGVVIEGTPTVDSKSFTFTVLVTDSKDYTGSQPYTITIGDQADVAGVWRGTIYQQVAGPFGQIPCRLELTQNDTEVTGISYAEDPLDSRYYALGTLRGYVSGDRFHFVEVEILEQNVRPGYMWIPMAADVIVDGNSMAGTWTVPGGTGTLRLTR